MFSLRSLLLTSLLLICAADSLAQCWVLSEVDFGIAVIDDPAPSRVFWVGSSDGDSVRVTIPERVGDFHFEQPGEYFTTTWQTFNVSFEPQTPGEHFANVIIAPDCGSHGDLTLTGFAAYPCPAVEVNREVVDFGMVLMGTTRSEVITITNLCNETQWGTISVYGPGFYVPEDQAVWNVDPTRSVSRIVRFSPVETGMATGSLDIGADGVDPLPLVGTGTETSPAPDTIGIYFEQSGQTDAFATSTPWEEVTAYLIVVGPSSASGIRGWECCVEMAGAGSGLTFELAGETMNVDAAPCFAVGMTGYPLPSDDIVVLATLRFWQPSPDEATWFYIHPATQPSVPGRPCYIDGIDEGIKIPLNWPSGDETVPIAMVNEGSMAGVGTVPAVIRDLHNHPNPFNPGTTIAFVVGIETPVRLQVYDVGGRIVRTLFDGQVLGAGRHEGFWDGRDAAGRVMSSGVYFYRLQAGDFVETKRMTLLK